MKLRLGGEQSAGEVAQSAARESEAAWEAEAAIMFTEEILHDSEGRSRRSIWCFNEEERGFPHIDLSSGRSADFESCSFDILRILSPSSALPSSPIHTPALIIETKSQLFEVSGARQLVPSHRSAISGAAFVALLRGLRCERSGKFFWEICSNCFVDSSSGALFQNKKQIPDAGPRSHAYCCLLYTSPSPRDLSTSRMPSSA